MKILTSYLDLVGKTISFTHMAQFADQITIATTDGEVLMVVQEGDEDSFDSKQVRVLSRSAVLRVLENSDYLRVELAKVGAYDLAAYNKRIAEEEAERRAAAIKRKEDSDRAEYERLKSKFEGSED